MTLPSHSWISWSLVLTAVTNQIYKLSTINIFLIRYPYIWPKLSRLDTIGKQMIELIVGGSVYVYVWEFDCGEGGGEHDYRW